MISQLTNKTGDDKGVSVGFDTNIQDGAVLSDYGSELNVDHDGSVYVGSHTTVGKFVIKQENFKMNVWPLNGIIVN